MITECVTKEKIDYWKQLRKEKVSTLKPNRISGIQLNEYFQNKYSPILYVDKDFLEVVKLYLIEWHGKKSANLSNIICYLVDEDVYVGIDLCTGFIHIESNNIEKCIPIYDDLQNFVLVGQYI